MPYASNFAAVRERMEQARDAGLIAAAHVVINEVKRGLRGGYTSGAFVTGHVWNSVTRTDPLDENGVRVIRVGTDVMYALFWEVGHRNVFTRKFERVEIWVPALLSTADRQALAFATVFARYMAETDRPSEAAD